MTVEGVDSTDSDEGMCPMTKRVYEKPVVETEPAFETLSGCLHLSLFDPTCQMSPGPLN
jgi:hypothetical protein